MSYKVIGKKTIEQDVAITVCDVCGRKYTDHESGGFETWHSEMTFCWDQGCSDGISRGWVVDDVCPECSEKIRAFIESLGAKISAPYDGILSRPGSAVKKGG